MKKLTATDIFNIPPERQIEVKNPLGFVMINDEKFYLQVFQAGTKEKLFDMIEKTLYSKTMQPTDENKFEDTYLMPIPIQEKKYPERKIPYLYYYADDDLGSRKLRKRESREAMDRGYIWLSDIAVILK